MPEAPRGLVRGPLGVPESGSLRSEGERPPVDVGVKRAHGADVASDTDGIVVEGGALPRPVPQHDLSPARLIDSTPAALSSPGDSSTPLM